MSSVNQERCDSEAGDKITIKVLRPRIVVAIQIIHEQRWGGPNKDRAKHGGVSFRQAGATASIDKFRNRIRLIHLGVRHVNLLA